MKVLSSHFKMKNPLFVPLAEAHERNYNVVYCYENGEPLEIEEVEDLVQSRTYEQIGKLIDLIQNKLKKAYENNEMSKLITVGKILHENGSVIVFVDSDYFAERVGIQVLMNGHFYVRLCPWADKEFAAPFFEAYEEWLTELTGIK